MNLNQYVAERRLRIFEELKRGVSPTEGTYDETLLKEGRAKGQPQLGATQYRPDAISLEFIYPDPRGAAVVLTVTLTSPERIVFMPVPGWVVEQIWQGEIHGSHQFESEANRLLEAFASELTPEANLRHFGRQDPTRRD